MSTTIQFSTAWLESRMRSDRAAALVEYALLVAIVGIVCAVAVTFLGSSSGESTVGSSLS